jgi:type IV pilus assembly protein PilB
VELPRAALVQAGFKAEALDGSWRPFAPVGCVHCHQGYRGRLGVFQVMPMSEQTQDLVLRDASSTEVARHVAREGVLNLREAGLRKVKLGLTSLEEILSHTNA